MHLSTKLVHRVQAQALAHGSFHSPLYSSVGFHHSSTQELIDSFQGRKKTFTYARSGEPTAAALEGSLTTMEGGIGTIVFSSGLAAIGSFFFALLKQGDHLLVSKFLFGNTTSFFKTLMRHGFEVSFVDVCSFNAVRRAVKTNTRFFFTETIANPRTQLPALKQLAAFCREKNIITLIDNTVTTPYLFRPAALGFHFAMHSLSKSLAGHAAALGGSLTDLGNWDWEREENILPHYKKNGKLSALTQIRKKGLRDFGAALSPFAAHLISLGLETLPLRLQQTNKNAAQLAKFLSSHPRIKRVYHPSLKSHPQHEAAKALFSGFGALLSFELQPSVDPLRFIDALKIIIRSTHLGDNRTLIIPVAPTIFHEMGLAGRKAAGIAEGLIRLSVGIEALEDLLEDLSAALAAA